MGWTPDGKSLLYYTPSDPKLIFRLVDVDTGEIRDVGLEHPEHRHGSLRYSPQGDWLSFMLFPDESSRERRIYVARVENGRPVEHSQWD